MCEPETSCVGGDGEGCDVRVPGEVMLAELVEGRRGLKFAHNVAVYFAISSFSYVEEVWPAGEVGEVEI